MSVFSYKKMLYAIHSHKNYIYIFFYIELLHSLSYLLDSRQVTTPLTERTFLQRL